MPDFIMLIGLPACGKSTWACHYAKNHPHSVVLSSDAIREELYGDESIQGDPNVIFGKMRSRALQELRKGNSVVYDATNICFKDRKGILNSVNKELPEVWITGIVFATPVEVCKEWNQKRARSVPDFVYDKMLHRWQTPFDGEGFNSILVVNPGIGSYDPKQYRLDIVEKVKAFGDQKNPHHTLSLFDHCQKCGEIAFEEYGHHFPAIAATIHDYGKIYTQSFDEAGVAHYYQHEAYSAYLALSMGFGLEISQLVCYHMMPYAYKGGEATWRARLGEVLWGLIEMLHDCDVRAH
jgi:predicted kinase